MHFTSRCGFLACGSVALLIAGCSRAALTGEQGAALAAAEGRWRRAALRDYSFEYHPVSFPTLGQASARIEVRGGVVKSVAPLGRHDVEGITIDELFRSIRKAAESGRYARIRADYDEEVGYPTRIDFTATPEIADGNAVIEVRMFRVLTGR